MDIYLTGHLVLAFGIFAKIYQSINQINQFIHLSNPSFFFVLGLKQNQKKSPRFSCPIFFVRPAPNCYTNTRTRPTNK